MGFPHAHNSQSFVVDEYPPFEGSLALVVEHYKPVLLKVVPEGRSGLFDFFKIRHAIYIEMRRVTSSLSSILLFCRNLDRTTEFYCSLVGLRLTKKSELTAELRDQKSNTLVLVKSNGAESVLSKGYSPILCFTVEDFEATFEKLKHYELPFDGEVVRSEAMNMLTVRGLEGEMICLTDRAESEELDSGRKAADASEEEIKRILSKLKM